MKTQAVNNKNNKPAEFLIKGPWWDNSVKWGALSASQTALVTTTAPTTTEEEKRGRSWQGQWDTAGVILWCHTAALPQKKKVGRMTLPYSMVPHGGMDCTMLMLVQSQHLDSESGLNTSAFMCGFICVRVCVCGLCACLCSQLNAECQGNPKPPSFSSCPFPTLLFFLPFLSSVSFSLLLSFCHLASVNGPLTETFRQLSHTGLCGVNGAHFIPPNLTAKTSAAALPINSWRQAINSYIFMSAEKSTKSLRSSVIVIEFNLKGNNWTLMIFRYRLICLLCPGVSEPLLVPWGVFAVAWVARSQAWLHICADLWEPGERE